MESFIEFLIIPLTFSKSILININLILICYSLICHITLFLSGHIELGFNYWIDWNREKTSIRCLESLSVTGLFCSPYFPLNLEVLAHNMKNTGLFVSTLYMFLPRCAGQRIETQLPPQLVYHVHHKKVTFNNMLRITYNGYYSLIKYKRNIIRIKNIVPKHLSSNPIYFLYHSSWVIRK